jgi:hypothetical protein
MDRGPSTRSHIFRDVIYSNQSFQVPFPSPYHTITAFFKLNRVSPQFGRDDSRLFPIDRIPPYEAPLSAPGEDNSLEPFQRAYLKLRDPAFRARVSSDEHVQSALKGSLVLGGISLIYVRNPLMLFLGLALGAGLGYRYPTLRKIVDDPNALLGRDD